jgi:hypothetical protein
MVGVPPSVFGILVILGDLPKLREGFGCIVRRCPDAQVKLTDFDELR